MGESTVHIFKRKDLLLAIHHRLPKGKRQAIDDYLTKVDRVLVEVLAKEQLMTDQRRLLALAFCLDHKSGGSMIVSYTHYCGYPRRDLLRIDQTLALPSAGNRIKYRGSLLVDYDKELELTNHHYQPPVKSSRKFALPYLRSVIKLTDYRNLPLGYRVIQGQLDTDCSHNID